MNKKIITILLLSVTLLSCGGGGNSDETKALVVTEENSFEEEGKEATDNLKGVGPITEVVLADLDQARAAKGEELFKAKCSACHKIEKRAIGPALKGVTERRTPEWIMNMILNPEVMIEKDPTAKALLGEYVAPMANQNLTEEEARTVLEFLRTKN